LVADAGTCQWTTGVWDPLRLAAAVAGTPSAGTQRRILVRTSFAGKRIAMLITKWLRR
jgi:hypothetical protein